jgi:hypothetical protein
MALADNDCIAIHGGEVVCKNEDRAELHAFKRAGDIQGSRRVLVLAVPEEPKSTMIGCRVVCRSERRS